MADQTRFNEVVTFSNTVTHTADVDMSSTVSVSDVLTLGNTAQSAGVFTSFIKTGINNVLASSHPATAGSLATGDHTLTAANLASGYCVVTANDANTEVSMPAKSVIIALFGGASKITVGDSIIWSLANAATDADDHDLKLTAVAGATVPSHNAAKVAPSRSDNSGIHVGGPPVARFLTRVINVDGSTSTVRL